MEPTPDTNESKKIPLFSFTDWKPYQDDNFVAQLQKLGIKYTPPKEREDLREIIKKRSIFKNDGERLTIGVLLTWLERGMMIDNFEKDEDARHTFLKGNKINMGDNKELSLYDLSKKLNKLTGNAITGVLLILQLIPDFRQHEMKLRGKIEGIKRERGYYIPGDLTEIDEAAEKAIRQILGIKTKEFQAVDQS